MSRLVEPPCSLSTGQLLLERYRVEELISLGGTSAVYLAEDERLSRAVCVKVLRPGTTAGGIRRTTIDHFVQEAFALSRLAHPNTLRIYDFGHLPGADDNGAEQEKTPFQIVEYINGGTLADRVRRDGPFGASATALIVTALAGALAEAHNEGIVHRDVKPTNILLVGSDGHCTPKLADFGIAKTRARSHATWQFVAEDTQIVAGNDVRLYSMYWSAPEQFLGLGVTPGADVYSLALVAAFMLSGRVVLQATDNRLPLVMRKHIDEHFAQALTGVESSRELLPLLEEACAFEVDRRISDVEVFATRLRQLLVGDAMIVGDSLIEPIVPSRRELAAPTSIDREPTTLDRATSVEPAAPVALDPSHPTTQVGDRIVRFVVTSSGSAEVQVSDRVGLRMTLLGAHGEPGWIHLKGLGCFISRPGGRPSLAVHSQRDESYELLSTDRRIVAHVRLRIGIRDAGYHRFELANQQFVIDAHRYSRAIALDFGPGTSCVFICEGVSHV
jgi:serine/threonine-protein kinase